MVTLLIGRLRGGQRTALVVNAVLTLRSESSWDSLAAWWLGTL